MALRPLSAVGVLSAAVATLALPAPGFGQSGSTEPLVIDDFEAGAGFDLLLVDPETNRRSYSAEESGLDGDHVLGGSRRVWFDSCARQVGAMPFVHDPAGGTFRAGGTEGSRFCEGPGFTYALGEEGVDASPYNALVIDLLGVDSGEPNPWFDPAQGRTPMAIFSLNGVVIGADAEDVATQLVGVVPMPDTSEPVSVVIPFSQLSPDRWPYTPTRPYTLIDGKLVSISDSLDLSFGSLGDNALLHVDGYRFEHLPSLDGDYNGDGQVNADDLTLFDAAYGESLTQHGTGADGNGDGVVDAADYTVWRDAMAATAETPLSINTSVPEPHALLLAATGLLVVFSPRLRR